MEHQYIHIDMPSECVCAAVVQIGYTPDQCPHNVHRCSCVGLARAKKDISMCRGNSDACACICRTLARDKNTSVKCKSMSHHCSCDKITGSHSNYRCMSEIHLCNCANLIANSRSLSRCKRTDNHDCICLALASRSYGNKACKSRKHNCICRYSHELAKCLSDANHECICADKNNKNECKSCHQPTAVTVVRHSRDPRLLRNSAPSVISPTISAPRTIAKCTIAKIQQVPPRPTSQLALYIVDRDRSKVDDTSLFRPIQRCTCTDLITQRKDLLICASQNHDCTCAYLDGIQAPMSLCRHRGGDHVCVCTPGDIYYCIASQHTASICRCVFLIDNDQSMSECPSRRHVCVCRIVFRKYGDTALCGQRPLLPSWTHLCMCKPSLALQHSKPNCCLSTEIHRCCCSINPNRCRKPGCKKSKRIRR